MNKLFLFVSGILLIGTIYFLSILVMVPQSSSVAFYQHLEQKYGSHSPYIIDVDFSKPCTEKRLKVIEIATGRVILYTYVAHGQGSGREYAVRFSNNSGSHESSLGVAITTTTYYGVHGLSLRLSGLDLGVNNNIASRRIVIHGAAYAGTLGGSWGCFAVPVDVAPELIHIVKSGTLLYAHI